MVTIRPFRNYDAPAVANLWNERRQPGREHSVSVTELELAILGRPFFRHQNLLVACSDSGDVIGYSHWLPVAGQSQAAVVAGIGVTEKPTIEQFSRDQIAGALLKRAIDEAARDGATQILFGQAPHHWTGYAGSGCERGAGGIPETSLELRRWATTAGFEPSQQLLNYALDLQAYRPVFDRDLLTMRRSATVDRRRDVTDQPFRIASAMSHLDMHRFVATQRDGKRLAEADFLVADPEMMVTNSSVILSRWSTEETADPRRILALRFVLSSAIAEIAADRSKRIQATITEENRASAGLLSSVGFSLDHSGTIFEKR